MKVCEKYKFTLVELLVVIAVIGILASLLLPSLSNARLSGMTAITVSNLRQIYAGTMMYADNNNGFMFLTSSNPHPANSDNVMNYGRLVYEEIQGFNFSNGHSDAISEMESGPYNSLMFCPVIRQNRGPARHHGQGRSDYSLNKHFTRYRNMAQLTGGKKEPLITPGTAMPSTQAGPTLSNGTYNPDQIGYPAYVYLNQKTYALYILGNVRPLAISEGDEVDSLINTRNNFE